MGTKVCVEAMSLAFVFGCVESPSLAFVFGFAVNGLAWVLVVPFVCARFSGGKRRDAKAGVVEEESRAFPLSGAAFPLSVRVAFLHRQHSWLAIHV